MTNDDNSILSEPETTFEVGTDEIKRTLNQLIAEGTPEAHDAIVQLAMDHGVPVAPEMTDEEIRDRIYHVL